MWTIFNRPLWKSYSRVYLGRLWRSWYRVLPASGGLGWTAPLSSIVTCREIRKAKSPKYRTYLFNTLQKLTEYTVRVDLRSCSLLTPDIVINGRLKLDKRGKWLKDNNQRRRILEWGMWTLYTWTVVLLWGSGSSCSESPCLCPSPCNDGTYQKHSASYSPRAIIC